MIRTNGIQSIALRSIGKPAASYPAAIATDQHLAIAVDRQQTKLAAILSDTATSMQLVNPAMATQWSLLSLDDEIVQVTGTPTGNSVPISRAFDGTTAAIHLSGAVVSGLVDAYHHNTLVAEVQAIETALGPNLSRIQTVNFIISTQYDFPPQTPGGSLTVGTNLITLSPVPQGVNGSDQNHYLYISGGTGTSEAVKITGGSAVAGAASGTLFVQCANAHAGAWTIRSATAGIQEGMIYGAGPCSVFVPDGVYAIHGPITFAGPVGDRGYKIFGTSAVGPTLNIASDFLMSALGVFVCPAPIAGQGPKIDGFTINFIQPDSANISAYTHWPPAFYMVGAGHFLLRDITVVRAWDVINMTGNAGGAIIENLQASHFHYGIDIDGSLDSVQMSKIRFWVYGLTVNQQTIFNSNVVKGLHCAKMDDLHITDFFATCGIGLEFYSSANGTAGANITGLALDSYSQMVISAGSVNLSDVLIGVATFNFSAIKISGSTTIVRLNTGSFFPGPNLGSGAPWIDLSGQAIFQMTNCWFYSAALDLSHIVNNGGNLLVSNCYFNRFGNTAYVQPTIYNVSGRITAIGNRTIDKGTGAGVFIQVNTDDFNNVRANSFVGWSALYPVNRLNGNYEDDNLVSFHNLTAGSVNHIASETGANNAIVGNLLSITLIDGTQVSVKLAHSLQAGANTFNFNSHGNTPIKSHRNPGLDIAAGYISGAVINLHFDATLGEWLDMSQ